MDFKTKLILIFAVASFAVFVCRPPSFANQVYEYKNGAGRIVRSLSPPPGGEVVRTTSNDRGDTSITTRCRNEWGKNYEMREYCMKNQREARSKLHRYSADIVDFCRKEWGDNYEMLEYCAKNQSAARKRIGD